MDGKKNPARPSPPDAGINRLVSSAWSYARRRLPDAVPAATVTVQPADDARFQIRPWDGEHLPPETWDLESVTVVFPRKLFSTVRNPAPPEEMAERLFVAVLHTAGHAACRRQGIADLSADLRYHTKLGAPIMNMVGLPTVASFAGSSKGFAPTGKLGPAAADALKDELAELVDAIPRYLAETKKGRKEALRVESRLYRELPLTCGGCTPARSIKQPGREYHAAKISCPVCGKPYLYRDPRTGKPETPPES